MRVGHSTCIKASRGTNKRSDGIEKGVRAHTIGVMAVRAHTIGVMGVRAHTIGVMA